MADAAGTLASPLPVAVKEIQLLPGCASADSVQHEANVLESLGNQPFSVPYHGLYLPPVHQPNGPAFLVMG